MFAYKILVPIKKIKNDYEHIIQQNFKNNILERKSFLTFKIYAMSKILLILKFLKQQTHKVCEYFCLLKRKKKKTHFYMKFVMFLMLSRRYPGYLNVSTKNYEDIPDI